MGNGLISLMVRDAEMNLKKKHKVEQFRELKNLLEEVKAGGFDTSKIFVVQR